MFTAGFAKLHFMSELLSCLLKMAARFKTQFTIVLSTWSA